MTNESTINSDFAIVIAARYKSSRNITELQALLVLAQQLEIALKELPSSLSNRTRIKTVKMHARSIIQRIAAVEAMNSKKNNDRNKQMAQGKFMQSLVESGLVTTLVTESRIARSEFMQQDKKHAQSVRENTVPAIKKAFELVGFNPLASLEDREEWLRKQERLKQNMPDTDLTAQGEQALDILQRAEQERLTESQTVPEGAALNTSIAPIVTELTDNIKSIDTGDKLGSAEDWLK